MRWGNGQESRHKFETRQTMGSIGGEGVARGANITKEKCWGIKMIIMSGGRETKLRMRPKGFNNIIDTRVIVAEHISMKGLCHQMSALLQVDRGVF